MTRYAPLWQQAGSYPAQLDRSLLGALWPVGGASGAAATAVANTMTVSLPPGAVAVPLAPGQGSALCRWDAAEVVTLDAAPPSGQSRIDVIVAQVRDTAIDAGPNTDFIFAVVKGTPAASAPAAPATPANAYAMYAVTVPGAAANLNGATITDRRTSLVAAPYALPAIYGSPVLTTDTFGNVNMLLPAGKVFVGGSAVGAQTGFRTFCIVNGASVGTPTVTYVVCAPGTGNGVASVSVQISHVSFYQ